MTTGLIPSSYGNGGSLIIINPGKDADLLVAMATMPWHTSSVMAMRHIQ